MKSKPSVLRLTETWADTGYKLISRHDRADGRQGGGVAVFALENLAHKVIAGTDLPHLERLT